MRAAFPATDDAELGRYYGMMEYHLGWRNADLAPAHTDPGKLVRPLLAILACQTVGGSASQALPLAAALQLLHDFSLIHDDIEDHSAQRRGRTTLWSLWGLERGINAGDGMFALAHQSIYRLADVGVAPTTVLAVARGFEDAIVRICEGQHLDMSGEGDFTVTPARYLQMIGGKTAALIAAATSLGARLATDDERTVGAMREFGQALGMAFQIEDDWLDIWGDPKRTGKPAAADLLQRKLSLPVLHALAHAAPAERATFKSVYRQAELSGDDLATLLAILERTGAAAATRALAAEHHADAEAALAAITPVDEAAFAQLQGLVQSLLNRAR